jgi:hypothetical protein
VTTLVGQDAYAEVGPLAEPDAAYSFALRALVNSVASMFAQPEEVVRALEGFDAWTQTWNVDRAPGFLLPFIGQGVGVLVTPGTTPTEQRAQIKAEGGWKRGRPSSFIAAVQTTLTGGKSVRLVERSSTAWTALCITRPSETASAALTKLVGNLNKPGGIVVTYEQSDEPLIDEGTKTIDASTGIIDTAKLTDIT